MGLERVTECGAAALGCAGCHWLCQCWWPSRVRHRQSQWHPRLCYSSRADCSAAAGRFARRRRGECGPKVLDDHVARRPRLARRPRSEKRGPARAMVASTAARGQAGPRAGHFSGGARRLSRRGLVLARFRRAGQSPRPRPLSAPLLDGRLSGRRLAERRPRRSPRRR